MKTKPLTFLLALTFLFLFSGSVYGGIFDKKGESVVFTCSTTYNLFSVDMNEKTITKYSTKGTVVAIYKIVMENEVIVKGEGKGKDMGIILHKHSYKVKNVIKLYQDGSDYTFCFIGDKKF